MDLTAILSLLGGIGLFLYGMHLMSESLNKAAGNRLESILEKLTSSKLKGLALGTGITALIQSSAATTIMVLGFVNAGIMKLAQTLPVIFGANIGSTITGQIIRLGDIGESNIILRLLKPSSLAPIIVAVGICLILFVKKKKWENPASILIGLGILFIGINIMEQAVSPLQENETFQAMFTTFNNPLFGILFGMLVTGIIQSSSASVGILQALTVTGQVTWATAIPIILGQNIGKCVTVWLGSIGTNKKAKRVAFSHLFFNVVGAAIFAAVIYGANLIFHFDFWNNTLNRGNVADFHTLFNVITALLLLPFTNGLVKLSKKIFKDDDREKAGQELGILDDIFLKTPAIALEQSKRMILNMGETVKENFKIATGLVEKYDEKLLAQLDENERFLDKAETRLNEYLVKVTAGKITPEETLFATEVIHDINNVERMGDYCVNIAGVAEYNYTNNIEMSQESMEDFHRMTRAVEHIIHMTMECFEKSDVLIASRVEPLEEVIDEMKEYVTSNHVERLKKGLCSVQSGISFGELINALERISDHCSNLAIHVIKRVTGWESFDTHEQLRKIHEGDSEEYKALHKYYESIYYDGTEEKE